MSSFTLSLSLTPYFLHDCNFLDCWTKMTASIKDKIQTSFNFNRQASTKSQLSSVIYHQRDFSTFPTSTMALALYMCIAYHLKIYREIRSFSAHFSVCLRPCRAHIWIRFAHISSSHSVVLVRFSRLTIPCCMLMKSKFRQIHKKSIRTNEEDELRQEILWILTKQAREQRKSSEGESERERTNLHSFPFPLTYST